MPVNSAEMTACLLQGPTLVPSTIWLEVHHGQLLEGVVGIDLLGSRRQETGMATLAKDELHELRGVEELAVEGGGVRGEGMRINGDSFLYTNFISCAPMYVRMVTTQ